MPLLNASLEESSVCFLQRKAYFHFCIWLTLLSKLTYIAFQGTFALHYQFLLFMGIEPMMTLVLQAL